MVAVFVTGDEASSMAGVTSQFPSPEPQNVCEGELKDNPGVFSGFDMDLFTCV